MKITIGLDFGTHQTKVCVEEKYPGLNYHFWKFQDQKGNLHYTLPSIISIDANNRLTYGYVKTGAKIIRYFKQAAFCSSSNPTICKEDAILYSCWYLAYILFDLEEKYGREISIQMGAPTDSNEKNKGRKIAAQILSMSYLLVEEEFKNDKNRFLSCTLDQLKALTPTVREDEFKDDFGILVFPEAYACLKPMIEQRKISDGMNLMVDIGGGTTDISFFTLVSDGAQIYEYFSIDKGLNYLTEAQFDSNTVDSNVNNEREIRSHKKEEFENEIRDICDKLYKKLITEYLKYSSDTVRFKKSFKNRPIIYSGGGSTFETLRSDAFVPFTSVKLLNKSNWVTYAMKDMNDIEAKNLCPILSTAYGLAIRAIHDNIESKFYPDLFENIRNGSSDNETIEQKNEISKDVC